MNYELQFKIIEQLVDFAYENKGIISDVHYKLSGRSPKFEDIVREFGSWEDAVIASGLTNYKKVSENEDDVKMQCLYSIREFISICGDTNPTRDDYIKSGFSPKYTTIRKYFRTWGNALEAAGYQANRRFLLRKFTKREIIQSLKKFYKENKFITIKAYRESGYQPNIDAIVKTFGSWNNALEEAKLPINRRTVSENNKKRQETSSYAKYRDFLGDWNESLNQMDQT